MLSPVAGGATASAPAGRLSGGVVNEGTLSDQLCSWRRRRAQRSRRRTRTGGDRVCPSMHALKLEPNPGGCLCDGVQIARSASEATA